jgi:hypothetical protein
MIEVQSADAQEDQVAEADQPAVDVEVQGNFAKQIYLAYQGLSCLRHMVRSISAARQHRQSLRRTNICSISGSACEQAIQQIYWQDHSEQATYWKIAVLGVAFDNTWINNGVLP